MAFFTVKTDEENIRDYSGENSSFINKSGIYEIIIKHVIVSRSANGSESIDLWIEHNGKEQPIFQAMRLTNNDGSPNLGQKMFNKFCVVAGATEGSEISDPVPMMVPMGKGGENVECMVLQDFDDTPMFIRIQMEYSLWEGKIREAKVVKNFFRIEDKATASEIVNNVEEKGAQYAKEEEYADNVTYKNDLTEEDVQEWLKTRRSGKKEEPEKKASVGFGQKRTFGRKV